MSVLLLAAGFACVTLAAILNARELLGRPCQERALAWTRAGFLLLAGALVAGALEPGARWPPPPRQLWGPLVWLIYFAVLHVHRVKGFKGRPAAAAGLAGWLLAAGAWLAVRVI
jgi:hypothetical protein